MATKNTKSAVWTEEDVEKAFVDVKKKALIDKTFRQTLLADPRKAIQQVTKREVPAAYKIKVIESDPAYHMTFVLPQMASADLSDEELEKVSGGVGACGADVCLADKGDGD
jgi:hypothetical protein